MLRLRHGAAWLRQAESEMVLRCIRIERVAMIERLRDIAAAPLVKRDNRTARARGHEAELACVHLDPLRTARMEIGAA